MSRSVLGRISRPHVFNPQKFPEKPLPHLAVRARIAEISWYLRDRPIAYNMGSMYTLPHPSSVRTYRELIGANPAHLGAYDGSEQSLTGTHALEHEVIRKMADLYHAPPDVTGYMTSGGTEGNLFAYWLGTAYAPTRGKRCLLTTPLTHYSVTKAGRIGGTDTYRVRLTPDAWNMDESDFRRQVITLFRRGYRTFLVCLTLGYSTSGTADDTERITRTARRLKRELSGTAFFFWIDAALNGLILPFGSGRFVPFRNADIAALVVDFHKFGLAPYPAGIVLYRKKFRRFIETPVDYLPQHDTTVSGSRSGVPAAAVWSGIHALGKHGLRAIVRKQQDNKQLCMKKLEVLGDAIRIITHEDSLTFGIMFPTLSNGRLPLWLEEKYWLYAGPTRSYGLVNIPPTVYKVFFLPHMTRRVVAAFTRDIVSVVTGSNRTAAA